ncbi:SUI1 family translation initiation factor, partial [Micromonospora aurantiaca (nom. illeg.)]|uniref:hypothetical protein n=1 Tax=Micromonospora aurantiaca (nom. illeg.) TaxID=47850 RepID=UPI00382CC163
MENTGYPCPGCGAPADLVAGCRACGRPPYPPAAEVVRLDREITELVPRVEAARLTTDRNTLPTIPGSIYRERARSTTVPE